VTQDRRKTTQNKDNFYVNSEFYQNNDKKEWNQSLTGFAESHHKKRREITSQTKHMFS
jgi:hypothetical protein